MAKKAKVIKEKSIEDRIWDLQIIIYSAIASANNN